MQQVLDEDALPHVTAHIKTQSGEVTTTQADYADPGGLGLKQQNERPIVTRLMKTLNGSCIIACVHMCLPACPSVCVSSRTRMYVRLYMCVCVCVWVVFLDSQRRRECDPKYERGSSRRRVTINGREPRR